jgi:dienelactone hydrolase
MAQLNWVESGETNAGVTERGFAVERQGQTIPGVFWQPSATGGRRPLVLMGHGGTGHKRNERMKMLGRLFAGDFGWCAAAIDGPAHGDRGPVDDAERSNYRLMWQRPNIVQSMADDWRATLDALCGLQEVDASRVGYWGVSMGTMFGLPYVANEPRVRVAVLGKAGMTGPSVVRSGIDAHFRQHAGNVRVPVLFTMQWDDERFDRTGQLTLFDMIAAADKRLHAYPGEHSANGPEAFVVQAEFLKRYL